MLETPNRVDWWPRVGCGRDKRAKQRDQHALEGGFDSNKRFADKDEEHFDGE